MAPGTLSAQTRREGESASFLQSFKRRNKKPGEKHAPNASNAVDLYVSYRCVVARNVSDQCRMVFDKIPRGPVVREVTQTLLRLLEVGHRSEVVQVTEASPLVESQSSNVGQVINRQVLIGLPVPNGAASSIAALAPGVVTPGDLKQLLSGVWLLDWWNCDHVNPCRHRPVSRELI
jgi:hypothetical protein